MYRFSSHVVTPWHRLCINHCVKYVTVNRICRSITNKNGQFIQRRYNYSAKTKTCQLRTLVSIFRLFMSNHLMCDNGCQSFRLQVVSPTSRFAYKSIRLHRGRFAYTTKVVAPTRSESIRLHSSRFAYTTYLLLNTKYLSKTPVISPQPKVTSLHNRC